ncbi:MAG: ferrous iron transporter B [Desulfobulbaceae bacterium]|nr:ferrous iron transporter B [Desulfobulbaceae bacterium]HIJ77819.1 ferrous iron transporter B [Deltaproteobacteria bacterium]
MKNCEECQSCRNLIPADSSAKANYIIVGNMNVGKSTLFARMRGAEGISVNIPGSTISVRKGGISGQNGHIYDTPGIHYIFSSNEDERASRDILLSPKLQEEGIGIIMVADAKNLKRSIAIFLQYAEYGLPMIFVVNMIDEAASRGIEIDYHRLSEQLGVELSTTIAREGLGIRELAAKLPAITPRQKRLRYSDQVEKFLDLVCRLLKQAKVSPRAVGLLLLCGDQGVEAYIQRQFGEELLLQLKQLAEEYSQKDPVAFEISLANIYQREASWIAAAAQKVEPPSRHPFILTLGDWCTKLSTGIPIAFTVVALMYLFVGSFGATFLADSINRIIFEGTLIPWINHITASIPSPFIKGMIADPDFGVLPSGIFLALGLVLPVIFCFYLAFGMLEDSGYLPRLSILLDRIFQKMGLNGKGVIPLVMGFSCVTMALLTTRVLNTEKEKNIASFLLFLCMPCAPLIAVMFVVLDKMPISATITVFGMIFLQILIAGYLADKILPGSRSPLLLEIPTMRVPKFYQVIKMASAKTFFFMKEALPVFVYASLAVYMFKWVGGLDLLEQSLGPIIGQVMGLPEKSVQVFIKTMIRRESGAAELEHLSGFYTNLQLVINLLVMTFIAPCLNAIIVLFKERGWLVASIIIGTVIFYAIAVGSIMNYTCHFFGITFT